MKPRLKLTCSGKLLLLSQGVTGLTSHQTRRLIQRNHGSLLAFARKYGVSYAGLLSAFSPQSERFAGQVAEVRCLLGLPSNPERRNLALAATHAARRQVKTKAGEAA